jgi:hypothetical protein
MTAQDVAMHICAGRDLDREIQEQHLERRYAKPVLKDLEHIAIGKISIGKDHRYLIVDVDLASGAVVFVGGWQRGRGFKAFLATLKMQSN